MKKVRNKQWRDRHAKIKHRHELQRRYKYNERYYEPSGSSYKAYRSEEYYQSEKQKNRLKRKSDRGLFETLVAPENFSLYLNPEETLSFFSKIQREVVNSNPVYFDMKNIEVLSIDTIMYFLAIVKKLKHNNINYSFKGSVPSETKCRDLLESSGFFNYVNHRTKRKDLNYESEVIKIANGQKAETTIAKKICDFAISKLNLRRKEIRKTYETIIELMSNTKQHAYNRRYYTITDWYIFVKFIEDKNTVRFIFLDTGEGIPTTVKRKKVEVIKSIVYMGPNHTEYIRSALEGEELRTRTGISYRGRGLPKIYSFNQNGYFNNLTIISNRGYFVNGSKEDIKKELKGTLFYWELSKES